MNDEYTRMKRELEEILCTVDDLKGNVRVLIERLERSDHPLRRERIAYLEKLCDCLTKI